ncbi:MAG: hypothetical protein A3H98_05080 [Bacteroidetes bacterium RIFCSPLOWO2_02_FULL_36_8]|nr:MAG: hypothetical protein A3H98_05080 [Bacteroidetes bacterium RIFCSPLOWO2_02_FULL_36_8]OFY70202.1 MAG: hypothetical protein A3G23_08625 [Bacteroidetes bacterium RIFCSPLOWO2_12_FULL_37_12]
MKHPILSFYLVTLYLSAYTLSHAQNPIPAPPQKNPVCLWGGTVHTGNDLVIENAYLRFTNGKITHLLSANDIKKDTITSEIIDVTGKQIYPGLIALNTQLGLNEIDAARATLDKNETGDYLPNICSIVAYNTDSKVTPTVRYNGILLAEVAPVGGVISGSSSLVELDAWNWEDALYKSDIAIHLNWPRSFQSMGWWAEPGPVKKDDNVKKLETLKQWFDDAKGYKLAQQNNTLKEKNLKLEAMMGLFDGTKKLFIHANFSKDIMDAVSFCKFYEIIPVIVDADDAWQCADFLKENNVPVILQVHQLPAREDDDYDLPYKAPGLLKSAGVLTAICSKNAWEQRTLMFQAGTAAVFGLGKESALKMITLNPAKILGVEKTVGSLDVGKDATLIVSEGDILDMKENNLVHAFIRGKKIELRNIQNQLYEKYMDKYGLKK